MRARIKPEEKGHAVVVDAHRRHFTHDWTEFPAEFVEQVRKNPYLEIEPEPEPVVEIEPEPEKPKGKRKVDK